MRIPMVVRVLVLLVILGSAPARAEEEIFLPEPAMISTSDPFPVDPRVLELQPGYAFSHSGRVFDNDGVLQSQNFARQDVYFTQFTYGVREGVDVNVTLADAHGVDFNPDTDGDGVADRLAGQGFADLAAGVRWQFYESEDGTAAAAFLTGITVPTGPRAGAGRLGLTQGFVSVAPGVTASKSWGRFQVLGEAGCTTALGPSEFNALGGLRANLGAGYQVGDHLKPLVELNYSSLRLDGGPTSEVLSVTAGLLVLIDDGLRLNLGVQKSIAGRNAPETCSEVLFVTFTP